MFDGAPPSKSSLAMNDMELARKSKSVSRSRGSLGAALFSSEGSGGGIGHRSRGLSGGGRLRLVGAGDTEIDARSEETHDEQDDGGDAEASETGIDATRHGISAGVDAGPVAGPTGPMGSGLADEPLEGLPEDSPAEPGGGAAHRRGAVMRRSLFRILTTARGAGKRSLASSP